MMRKDSSLKAVAANAHGRQVVIHPTAVVDPKAELDMGVDVGPYAVVGARVRIGRGTRLGPHVVVEGDTTLGENNRVFPFACIGMIPQDSKYNGEPTALVLGDRNTIREYVTLNLGTDKGGGVTKLGNDCLVMAYCHVAHDCDIGDNVVFANGVTLAGHVSIGDTVTVGGLSAVHQFARIGRLAFIGGGSMVSQDVPPFLHATGDRARLFGVNVVGLKRKGFSGEAITALKEAYRLLFRSGQAVEQAIDSVRSSVPEFPEVTELLDFVRSSDRGVVR